MQVETIRSLHFRGRLLFYHNSDDGVVIAVFYEILN